MGKEISIEHTLEMVKMSKHMPFHLRVNAFNLGQQAVNKFWTQRGYEVRNGKWWKK